ncbi:hypothetical protein HDF19_08895 [Mucilaginibacter sp. E4BP6]|jgi:hypothetical protein|uniref:hypothetical protein n=1 Tax=Mucilaginibacter sp. E4BP6 TaxID=2723089 RepID=UPI0015CA038F|nr:hypothetical protein [Mucilaginibacter sp. E4BP6]NYE68494.1 hypothetical protein [Mucilaginibacter sp. E4BP6]
MKNLFKVSCLAVLLFAIWSCNSSSKKTATIPKIELNLSPKTAADSNKNDSIAIAQVTALPEFNNILKWFQKNNKDTTQHIGVVIGQEPVKGFNYFWVKVGVNDSNDQFKDMEHFYVNSKDQTVHYLDIKTDSLMSLEQWRGSGKDSWKN